MGESPAQALRRKPRASIKVAADLVARGEAAALFSAGNTGATVLAAYAGFGLLQGRRAPGAGGHRADRRGVAVLLDVGANANCRPQHLLTFGVMGAVFARVASASRSPAVGLLSIGEEETKGNELTREAHRLLRATPLRFIGNVEARDVYSGAADVVVCDGFTGNVAIKVSEGSSRWWTRCWARSRGGPATGARLRPLRARSSTCGAASTTRSTAARRCSASAGRVRRGARAVVGQGRAQRDPAGAPVRAEGLVPRIEQELSAAAGRHHRDCIHLSGTGIAEGRHGQGARRRVSRGARDDGRGRRGAGRGPERPVLQRAGGSAGPHREHAAGDPGRERRVLPRAGVERASRRRSSRGTASASTRRTWRPAR